MKNRDRVIIASAILLGAAAFLNREKVLLVVGNYLVIQDRLVPADVIHVIAGDDYRTEYGIQLYKQGYAKYIFFTGGWYEPVGWHGAHGQQLALQRGIPLEAIVFDDTKVTSTYDEVMLLKAWMDQSSQPIQSVMVVSDPFHMRRARWTYRRVLGKEAKILLAPVQFESTPYKREWWKDQESQNYIKDEYIKSVYYLIRYKLAWGRFKDWLAVFDVN
jgi:uncharacterized SAM-binding protein YcdF (DUF218 family)